MKFPVTVAFGLLLGCFSLGLLFGLIHHQPIEPTTTTITTAARPIPLLSTEAIDAESHHDPSLQMHSEATDNSISSRRHLLSVVPGPLSVSPGYYAQICPAGGYYCPTNNTQPVNCPLGSYCNGTGNSAPTACTTPGTYCPMNSEQPLQCPAGSYCPSTSTIIPCPTGFLCPAGSIAPQLDLSTPRPGLTMYLNSDRTANYSSPNSLQALNSNNISFSSSVTTTLTGSNLKVAVWPRSFALGGPAPAPFFLMSVQPHSLAGLFAGSTYRATVQVTNSQWSRYYYNCSNGRIKFLVYRGNTATNVVSGAMYETGMPLGLPWNSWNVTNSLNTGFDQPNTVIASFDVDCQDFNHSSPSLGGGLVDNNGVITLASTFAMTTNIADAVIGLSFAPTIRSGVGLPPYVGQELWYFGNMSVTLLPGQVQSSPTLPLQTGTSDIVNLPKQPTSLDPILTSACPHLQPGLTPWENIISIVNETQPMIILPPGQILYSTNSNPRNVWWQKIVISNQTTLIFDDVPLTVHLENMLVLGALRIGDAQCRLQSVQTFYFHANTTAPSSPTGNDPSCNYCTGMISTSFGTKGIAAPVPSTTSPMNTSIIELHGYQYTPTWTRLAASVHPGDIFIYLQDANNWEVGQSIGLVTSTFYDELKPQNEVLVIAGRSSNGTILQLTQPAQFHHYAGNEYQSEVGLLSRRISFQAYDLNGEATQSRIGGHIVSSGQLRVSGIELYKMGQRNVLGRYPLHWHLAGSALPYASQGGLFIRDASFHATYFRCLSIHATHNATVTRSVGFDVTAHCFFIEDGVEQNNTISFNLGASVHAILPAAQANGWTNPNNPQTYGAGFSLMAGVGQPGAQIPYGSGLVHASDAAPAAFYITNANNYIYGNAASGGFSGFNFIGLKAPTGISATSAAWTGYVPVNVPTLLFAGNTAHSAGYTWEDGGACIYSGGDLRYNTTLKDFYYDTGRYRHGIVNIDNTKVWLCNLGAIHWATGLINNSIVTNYEAHDINYAVKYFSGRVNHAIFNAHSANPQYHQKAAHGFFFYDTGEYAFLVDIELRNYQSYPLTDYPTATIFTNGGGVTNYETSPIDASQNIRFTNCDRAMTIITMAPVPDGDSGRPWGVAGAYCFNFADFDGTVANQARNTLLVNGTSMFYLPYNNAFIHNDGSLDATTESWPIGKPAIIGNANNLTSWWHLDNSCILSDSWSAYVCEMTTARRPIQLEFNTGVFNYMFGGINNYTQEIIPFYERFFNAVVDPNYGLRLGQFALFGPGLLYPDRQQAAFNIRAKTGVSGLGWWWNLFKTGGSPRQGSIAATYMYPGVSVVVGVPYPAGSIFTVTWRASFASTPLTQCASRILLVNSPIPCWYFDQANFFLKIYPSPDGLTMFSLGGASLPGGFLYQGFQVHYEWSVTNCGVNGLGICPVPNPTYPLWDTFGCPAGGYYCPTNSSQPINCPKGFYCNGTGNVAPTLCPAGTYCPYTNMETPITCSIGYYCPQPGAVNMTLCPLSRKCNTTGMITPNYCSVFVTPIPYYIIPSFGNLTNNVTVLGSGIAPRYFDFSGDAPFVNLITHNADIGTINYWNTTAYVENTMNSNKIVGQPTGVAAPGHVFKYNDTANGNTMYTATGVLSADGISQGKVRTMINTYAIPMGVPLVFEMEFILAGNVSGGITAPYEMTPRGIVPSTIWQVKSDQYPSLGISIDTNATDPTWLEIVLDNHGNETLPSFRMGTTYIRPNQLVQMRVELVLDERSTGRLIWTVNGQQVPLMDSRQIAPGQPIYNGPTGTNSINVTNPYQVSFAVYCWHSAKPLNTYTPADGAGVPINGFVNDRFIYWKTAQMFQRQWYDANKSNYTMCN